MKIIFNPTSGALIQNFVSSIGKLGSHPAGELRQYEDISAAELLETFDFLREVTADEAKKILEKPPQVFKCDFCEFTTEAKIALAGHSRKHAGEAAAKQQEVAIDATLVPVAEVMPTKSNPIAGHITSNLESKGVIPSGMDKHGVEWYGDGLQEESLDSAAMKAILPIGQRGHFGA